MSLTPCTEVGENKVWEGEDSLPSLTFVSSGNWWRSPAGERAARGPGGCRSVPPARAAPFAYRKSSTLAKSFLPEHG